MKVGAGHPTGTWGHLFACPCPLVLQSGIKSSTKGKFSWPTSHSAGLWLQQAPHPWGPGLSLQPPVPWEQDVLGQDARSAVAQRRMDALQHPCALRHCLGRKAHVSAHPAHVPGLLLVPGRKGAVPTVPSPFCPWGTTGAAAATPSPRAPGAILTPGLLCWDETRTLLPTSDCSWDTPGHSAAFRNDNNSAHSATKPFTFRETNQEHLWNTTFFLTRAPQCPHATHMMQRKTAAGDSQCCHLAPCTGKPDPALHCGFAFVTGWFTQDSHGAVDSYFILLCHVGEDSK